MDKQVPIDPTARADHPADDGTHEVISDVAYQRLFMVNVVFVGAPGAGDRNWVLVDAGLHGTAGLIAAAAEERFGKNARPAAIVLTHGHVDHVGALEALAERWQAPVFAHPAEHRYLDGRDSYPPPDPTVGGGAMSALSRYLPRGPIDITRWLRELPADGSIPGMRGFRWIATPGHTPGHVSLWRNWDLLLISGDAVITTKQESAYGILTQSPEMHGPPQYFTPDWDSARNSVQRLAALQPEFLISGHGHAMRGDAMRTALVTLAERFDEVAVPRHGRYVEDRAIDSRSLEANDTPGTEVH